MRRQPNVTYLTPGMEDILKFSIWELQKYFRKELRGRGVDVKTLQAFYDMEMMTIEDLLMCPVDKALRINNIGVNTLEYVYEALEQLGFIRYNRG